MQIFKYPIEIGQFSVTMPKGSIFLSAELQNDRPYFWAAVNTENDVETRDFEIIGTGHKFDEQDKKYLATFQQGPFVWHLHEVIKQQ